MKTIFKVALVVLLALPVSVPGQRVRKSKAAPVTSAEIAALRNSYIQSRMERAHLREEFVQASKDYKASLEKLRASYDKDVRKAEEELIRSRETIAAGMVSPKAVEAAEAQVAQAKDKVAEVDRRLANADSQVAETLSPLPPIPTDKELAREIRASRRQTPNCTSWTVTLRQTPRSITYKVTCYR